MTTPMPVAADDELRLFYAVHLAPELQPAVAELQGRLACARVRVKWVEPENLHFTLKFLGEMPGSAVPQLSRVASHVAARHSPFVLNLAGVGAFPRSEEVRVIWIGCIAGGDAITALASDLDGALAREGLAPAERRPFQPHLTVGRCRQPTRSPDLTRAILDQSTVVIGRQEVTRFALVRSELRPTGPLYTVIQEYPLGEPRP